MKHQSLAEYSTYKIGGTADYFAKIQSKAMLLEALAFAKKKNLPIHILGKGSNTLFLDQGFRGLVLLLKFDSYEISGTTVRADAGFSFSLLGSKTARAQLTGLEYASGIPGSVGGAVFMNAGAGGSEVKDSLAGVKTLTQDGVVKSYTKDQLSFGYRSSPFQKNGEVILEATFQLQHSESAKAKQNSLLNYRLETQPYKAKTIGCTFRNPEGDSAGRLIEACGLKGYSIGGARVSMAHANFIENYNNATAKDVLALVEHIETTIQKQTGILLEREIRTIPSI